MVEVPSGSASKNVRACASSEKPNQPSCMAELKPKPCSSTTSGTGVEGV